MLEACEKRGIALEAYSPLGHGGHISSETVARIAQRRGRTAAQVLLRWCIGRDIPLIAKSTHREPIAENAQVFDFALSAQDMAELDELDRTAAPTSLSRTGGGEAMNQVPGVWDASTCALLPMDYQPEIIGTVFEQDRRLIELNVRALADLAVRFEVPVVPTSGRAPGPAGHLGR